MNYGIKKERSISCFIKMKSEWFLNEGGTKELILMEKSNDEQGLRSGNIHAIASSSGGHLLERTSQCPFTACWLP